MQTGAGDCHHGLTSPILCFYNMLKSQRSSAHDTCFQLVSISQSHSHRPAYSLHSSLLCPSHRECCFFDSLLIASANLDGEKQQNIFHRPSILPLRTMECNSIMNYCVSLQPGAGRGRGRGTAVTAPHTLTAVISRISTP